LLISEKITFSISLWIVLTLLLTGNENLELFFVLILIGILIIRELSNIFITPNIKDRLNLFIYIFIVIFIIIVGKKIVDILIV